MKDAAEIWRLVRDCNVLETNSCYAYLIACRDFSETSLVVHSAGELLGFVIGYVPPARPGVVFVWQVGVGEGARQRGLGRLLLRSLIATVSGRGVRFLEATVTPSNRASRRLFESAAEEVGGRLSVVPGFAPEDFGSPDHEAEELVRISLRG